jgi:hypothetical protein
MINLGLQMTLKHFAVDSTRHQLVADVQFYQMNLASVVEIARTSEPEAFMEDGIFLPSWSKFAAEPKKAKGFFVNMLQAVFLDTGKASDPSLNIDLQTGRKAKEGTKVAMMFLSGSFTNDNLLEIKPFAEQALPGFKIVLVSGAADMTNKTAQGKVKEIVEDATNNGQHVLILSAGMAQRSFSIPEITELYLAYDSGDNGATIQKMSRTLTPHKAGKVGRVISLSFDPNRDDKFDTMLIETALNYKANKGIADTKQALADVLRTVDIFKCQAEGAVKVEIDTYLEEALARNSIDRVVGKVARLEDLSPAEITALASGKSEVFKAAKQASAARGKTRLNVTKNKKGESKIDVSAKEIARAREVITTIAQNIDIIRYYGGESLQEAFAIMDSEGSVIQDDVTEQFGVDYELVKELVLGGIINRDLLDLKFA